MSITLTEAAAVHVRKFLAKVGKAKGLRVSVKTTGCSGLMYVVDCADTIEAEDQVFESHGINVIIDEKSLAYLDGTQLDYSRESLNEGLKFNNPNVKNACGCGESFSV
jgi:iron-sulfur cluster assembly protein